MPTSSMRALRRQQLDRQFSALRPVLPASPPQGGWLRTIREALGMSQEEWAKRMGISQGAAAQMERREREGVITLKSLETGAAALGCGTTYAVLPTTTLSQLILLQAHRVAESIVDSVEHNMSLEDQATDARARQARIEQLTNDLLNAERTDVWSTSA